MIYIAMIQMMLFYLATVVVMCELTNRFSNSFLSVSTRFAVAVSFIITAYYAKNLHDAPQPLIFALLLVVVFCTVMVTKYILQEYFKRLKKANRYEKY